MFNDSLVPQKLIWSLTTSNLYAMCLHVRLQAIFLKVPRLGGELGIFMIFVYFLSQLQRLRPLGYCAPVRLLAILEPYQLSF